MKYKTLGAVALMMATWTADTRAVCPPCDGLTGESCYQNIPNKLHPAYWACRSFVASIWVVCTSYMCPGSTPAHEQKLTENQNACQPGEDIGKCEDALNADIANAEKDLSAMIQEEIKKSQKELRGAVSDEAKKEHDTPPPKALKK